MLTDGLRALWLEACGYDTKVFEFVSLEHTNKNKMILAVKRPTPKPAAPVLQQIDDIKRFYGIREQCHETLLRERHGRDARGENRDRDRGAGNLVFHAVDYTF